MKRLLLVSLLVAFPTASFADEIEREPINYDSAPTCNPVSRLEKRLAEGQARIDQENPREFLRGILRAFQVPESSQVLVFSKTSLQRQKIAPETPRAIFFNDEIYIGSCQGSNLFEVSAVDSNLGTVFYTLEHRPGHAPKFVRQNDACMSCHGSSATQGFPGHMVRSVFSDPDGYPILSNGTYRIDHRSPLNKRWGGWYVSGTSGAQKHLGNRLFRADGDRQPVQPEAADNLTDLAPFFAAKNYLNPHSDIVALMVLEHQAEMQNLLTRANFQIRIALHHQEALNKELGRPADYQSDTTYNQLRNAGEAILKYLLFHGEVPLTDRVAGNTTYTKDFMAAGPRDSSGRSLRDFDLNKRLFAYPCSYLIYSPQFDALPPTVRDYVLQRLHQVLTGRDQSSAFAHLTSGARQAILEILRATKPDLPSYWR